MNTVLSSCCNKVNHHDRGTVDELGGRRESWRREKDVDLDRRFPISGSGGCRRVAREGCNALENLGSLG